MAYDLAILNAEGAPCRQVSFGVDDHFRLIAIAKDLGLQYIPRLSDYYADADFLPTEMDGLQTELMLVRDNMTSTKQMVPSWMATAIELLAEAKSRQTGIVGIAD
jgi:hypothetical protein